MSESAPRLLRRRPRRAKVRARMVVLSTRAAPAFPIDVRARGGVYFLQKRVTITRRSSAAVDAVVRGARRYAVRLERAGLGLRVRCSCPHFESAGPCKHVWAALLAVDGTSSLVALRRGSGEIRVIDAPPDGRGEGDEEDDEDDDDLDEEDDEDDDDDLDDEEDDDDDRDDGDHEDLDDAGDRAEPFLARPMRAPTGPARGIPWRDVLDGLRRGATPEGAARTDSREIAYLIDLEASRLGNIVVQPSLRGRAATVQAAPWRPLPITRALAASHASPNDRRILSRLLGSRPDLTSYSWHWHRTGAGESRFELGGDAEEVLEMLAATGRCRLQHRPGDVSDEVLRWDGGEPWKLAVALTPDGAPDRWRLVASLRRGGEAIDAAAVFPGAGRVVFAADRIVTIDAAAALRALRPGLRPGGAVVPAEVRDDLIAALLALPEPVELDLPPELRLEEVRSSPRPSVALRAPRPGDRRRAVSAAGHLACELGFDYDGAQVEGRSPARVVLDRVRRRLVVRDAAAEAAAREQLLAAGFKPVASYTANPADAQIAPTRLPSAVRALIGLGWQVRAEGKLYKSAGALSLDVTSGVDWFEVRGKMDFGGEAVPLPRLLAAIKRGETMVTLGDGSLGVLPEAWLERLGLLAKIGSATDSALQLRRSQVGLFDALLAADAEIRCDAQHGRLRKQIREFDRIPPADAPSGFHGVLRGYQRDGLAWLLFLQRFGLGGCLADDMGLGKTVQVLALLASRPRRGKDARPSLVVAPRSLVENWMREAARFAPSLRVLDHTGVGRLPPAEAFAGHDLIVTTYGTLRREAALLRDVELDYAILDEAQAIKNASSESAKAARLLRARHRLALSGTPIENHLGELGSLLEFLNPGMVSAGVLGMTQGRSKNVDAASLALLAKALRPVLLRRTKAQVAPELPARLEETLYCEMEPPQRALYDELRVHYKQSLLARVARHGIARSKIHVLEALLRLRQAACHPGLVDPGRARDKSAKLDALFDQLATVVGEGHKVLVFSQFTTLLGLVRARLDAEGTPYEYLDGKTADRASRVDRFQNDAGCPLFLVSLKAGGVGLNLTAADYVILLDPWWNPAVEAQAIDRAHRIGQNKPVFAYRYLCKDSIEEKIAELGRSKRALAESVIHADASLVRDLTAADLELLLS